MKMKSKLVLSLSFVIAASAACQKNDKDDSKKTDATAAGTEVSSAEQLRNAQYKNDQARKLLSKYTTGKEFCQKFESVTSKEKGVRIKVPVDYKDETKGTTEIYAFFANAAFDPEKPTLIYFDGGSGGNSHAAPVFTNSYNQLHFDQRGIACSRPAKLGLYRDPKFYSSENTARDANEIRKHFQIDKLSVYGASYGTVPATIFGNLFPEATTAVVLEGVMFSNSSSENSLLIQHHLKKMYATFPQATKDAMLSYFDTPKAAAIFTLARMAMYGNSGFKKLKEKLLEMFPSVDGILKDEVKKYFEGDIVQTSFFDRDDISAVDQINNKMLNCKESDRSEFVASLFYKTTTEGVEQKYEFVAYPVKDQKDETCEDLDIPKDAVPYTADRYPLNVPVTYFQGTWDGATMAKGAVQHWKKVPRAQRQLFMAVEGGHSPNYSALSDLQNQNVRETQRALFEKVLAGELSSAAEAEALNEHLTEIKWVYTQKEVTLPTEPAAESQQTAAAAAAAAKAKP